MSNADNAFSEVRLGNCEVLYSAFFQHFRSSKGFVLQAPVGKLHAVVFRTQGAFSDFVGTKISPFVTGIYIFNTNRLVMYDFATNLTSSKSKRQAEELRGQLIGQEGERQRCLDSVNRRPAEEIPQRPQHQHDHA